MVNPCPQLNRRVFLKEKTRQNDLKRENMYLEGFRVILIFALKIIGFDHSESIDIHIEKSFCGCPQKTGYSLEGGGVRNLRTCPQLLGFV